MKLKYKIYYFCLGIVVLLSFVTAFKILEVKDIPNHVIKTAIDKVIDINCMQQDDGKRFKKNYCINKNEFAQFLYYCPKSNMEANEILVLKTTSKQQEREMRQVIEERMKKQTNSFKTYNTTQYEIAKDYILESKNEYIILIVAKDYKKIRDSLNKLF